MITALLLSAVPWTSGVTVTLPMEARVRGTEISVGQVAEVTGADAALVETIRGISLGYAPAPGFSRLIWNHKIAEAVAAHDPELHLELRGQRATRVWPIVDTVSAERVVAVAEARITEAVSGRDFSWELREELADLQVPAGDGAPELVATAVRGNLQGGVVSVPVEVRVGGQVYRTLWTSWTVQAWENVPVLVGRVAAGERVAPELIETRRIAARPGAGKPLTRDRLLGATATRDLAVGEIVTDLDVHRPPAVSVGDSVFLQVVKGAISARVPAIARQSGAIGDRIKVMRTDRSLEMSAVIVSRDVVQIDLGDR